MTSLDTQQRWMNLYAKMSKCIFGVEEAQFLGYKVNGQGVRTDESVGGAKLAAAEDGVRCPKFFGPDRVSPPLRRKHAGGVVGMQLETTT